MASKITQGIHLAAKGYFKARGYKWEVCRSGDVQIGYWKLNLSGTNATKKKRGRSGQGKKTYPKRFVLIAGFGDTPMSWYPVLSLLTPVLKYSSAPYDELIFLDLPGFAGFQSQERAFSSMTSLMGAVGDCLDGLKPHTVLGHSLGGWLASKYATEWGMGVRPKAPTVRSLNYTGPEKLILVCATGVYADNAMKEAGEELFRKACEQGFEFLRPHIFGKEPFWFKWIQGGFQSFLKKSEIREFIYSVKDEHWVNADAEHIRSKVFLVWGEIDTLVPVFCVPAWLTHLNARLPNPGAKAIMLPRSGHSPHVEQPLVMATVLGQIISGKSLPEWKRLWRWAHATA